MFLLSLTRYVSSFIWIIRPREYKFSLELKKLKLHKNWDYWERSILLSSCCIFIPSRAPAMEFNVIKYARRSLKTWIFYSVQFSRSVLSDSLLPHEPQHSRPPCPSPPPGVHPNPCTLSRWYHPAISSSVIPFSSCPQSLQASESFPMSQLFAWGGQSIGVSASASVLPMNTPDRSPLGWTGWISLQNQATLKSLLQHHSSKASILQHSALFIVQLSHPYMTSGKIDITN